MVKRRDPRGRKEIRTDWPKVEARARKLEAGGMSRREAVAATTEEFPGVATSTLRNRLMIADGKAAKAARAVAQYGHVLDAMVASATPEQLATIQEQREMEKKVRQESAKRRASLLRAVEHHATQMTLIQARYGSGPKKPGKPK